MRVKAHAVFQPARVHCWTHLLTRVRCTRVPMTSTTLGFPLFADPVLTRFASALASPPALETLRTPLAGGRPGICFGGDEALTAPLPRPAPLLPLPIFVHEAHPILPTALFPRAPARYARTRPPMFSVGGWRGWAATVRALLGVKPAEKLDAVHNDLEHRPPKLALGDRRSSLYALEISRNTLHTLMRAYSTIRIRNAHYPARYDTSPHL
ncbi:hypothetical protein DFH06DRAFT_1422445 [Mycena polygramma]|nr:hypothetical protein DFH06DRAFT_1422445 [Mycena polygramma]